MTDAPTIRPATVDDAPAVSAIYAPYVERTAVSFESEPPSVEEMASRIAKCSAHWAWLVAEVGSHVVGYAYGTSHRERAAYRWSTETSAYVAEAAQGRGLGRALYTSLLDVLAARGYCNAYAGIVLPNEASVRLHRAVDFAAIGTFPRVGFKLGAWHDVAWFHRALRAGPPPS